MYLTTRYTHWVGVRARNTFTYLCISLLDIPTESGYVQGTHLPICVSHYSIYPPSRGTYIYLFVYLTTRYTHRVGVRTRNTFTYLCISLLDIPTESGYVQGTHLPICVSHYSIYPPSRGTYIYLFVYLTTRYTHRVGVRTRNTLPICVSHYSIYPPSRGTYKEHIYLLVYLTTRYTHRVGVRTRNTLPICVSHYSIYPPSRGTYKEHITYLCISLLDIPTQSGYVQGTHYLFVYLTTRYTHRVGVRTRNTLPICVSHYSIYPPSRGTYKEHIYLFVYLTTRYTHRVGVRTFTYLCISLLDIPTESGYVHLPICVSHYSIYPPSRGTYKEHITYLCISLLDIPTESGYVQGTHLPISVSHYSIYPPSRGTYKEHIYLFVYLTTRYTHRVGVRTRNTLPICVSHYSTYPPSRGTYKYHITYLCISLLDIPTESGYVQGTHLPISVSHYSIYPLSRGTYIYLFVYLTTRYTHRVGVRARNTVTYLCISLLDIPTESGYVHLPICVSHYSIYPPSRGTCKEHITYLCISLLDIPTESGYVQGTHYLFVYLTTRYTHRVGVRTRNTLPICVSHYSIYPPSRGTYKEHIYLLVYLTTRYTHRVGVRARNTFTYLCISLLDIPTKSGYVHLPICVSHYSIYPPSRGTCKEHITYLCISLLDIPTESGYVQGTHYLFVYLTTRYTHRVGVRARNTVTYLCISLLDIPTESGYVQGTHLPISVSHYSIYPPSRGTYKEHIYLFVYLTTRYTHRVGVRTFTYLCISLLDIPTESGYVQGTHLPICVSHYSIYPPSRGTYKEHIYLFVYLTTRYTHRVGVRTFTYLCISLLDIPTESGYVQGTHLPISVSHYSIYPPSRGTYKAHIYLFVYLTTRYTHRVGVRTFTYLCISLLDIPTESGYVQGTHYLFVYLTTRYTHRLGVRTRNTLPICVSHYSIYPPSRGTYKEHITYLCISLLDIPTQSGYVQGTHYLFVYLTTRYTHRVGVRTRNTLPICVSHYSIYPPSRGTYKEHIYLFVYLTTRYTHRVGVRTFTYLCIALLDIPTESGYVHLPICVSHYSIYPPSRGTYKEHIYLLVYLTTRYTHRVGVRTRHTFTYLCISLLDIPTESGYVQGTHLPICVSHYSIYPPSRGTYIYLFVYLTTRYTHRVGVRTRNTFTYLCISLLDIPTESGYVQGTHYLFVYLTTRHTHRVGVRTNTTLPICVSHYSIYPPSRGTCKEHIYLLVYLTTRYTHWVGVRTFTYLCISLLDIPTESGYVQGTQLPICVSHYSIYPPSRGTYIYLFVYLTTRYTHRVGVRARNTLLICVSHYSIYPPSRGTCKEHITYLCIPLLDIPTESGYVQETHYLFVYLTTRYTHRVGVRTRNTFTY